MKSITAEKLAQLVGGQLVGSPDAVFSDIAEIADSTATSIVFAVNAKYVERLRDVRCGVAVVPLGEWSLDCAHVKVANPYMAMAQILNHLSDFSHSQSGVDPRAHIHPSAVIAPSAVIYPGVVIDANAQVGPGSILYPGVFLGQGVVVGSDCLLHAGAVVREHCRLGNRVILQPNCVIGSDGFGFVRQGRVHHKIPQIGSVVLEDDVEVGSGTTIDRGTFRATVIGKGSKLDNLVQIGHNVVTGEGCLFASQSGVSGSTTVGNFVTFAGQSGCVGHIHIGDNTVLMARAVATQSLPGGQAMSGFPCQEHKLDLKEQAAVKRMVNLRRLILKIAAILKIKE